MRTALLAISLLSGLTVLSQSKDAQGLIYSGNQWYVGLHFEKAVADYKLVPVRDPLHAVAQYNLANALFRLEKTDEALQVYTDAAENTKDKALAAKAWYNKGVQLSKLQRTEESIEAYKNALRRDPADQQARENLQKALLELKKKQKNKQPQKQKPKPQPQQMNRQEAEQKLKLLEQKEKQVQQRMQQDKSKSGGGAVKDW